MGTHQEVEGSDSLVEGKIIIIGGFKDKVFQRDIEVIDASSSRSTCPAWPDLDKGFDGANGGPIICGGYDGSDYLNQCYQFLDTRATQFCTMNERRGYSASVAVDNTTLWITGGMIGRVTHSSSYLQSTEFINHEDRQSSPGPDLPYPLSTHAIVAFDSKFLVIGGLLSNLTPTALTHYYNKREGTWQAGPKLKIPRAAHSAAVARDTATDEEYLVAVGGWSDRGYEDSVEILYPQANKWKEGPRLPGRRTCLSLARVGSTDVIAIGGQDERFNYIDTLFRLRCANRTCQWSEMPQKLNKPSRYLTAISVPNCS